MIGADHPDVAALLARSNRLGSDRRLTNYGGGNTSAKVVLDDPVTGLPTRVLAVKGSGGDLATLSGAGLAFLTLDRLLALEAVHDGGVDEDSIVAYYEWCAFGGKGAVPSIDTPLHAFVTAAHVDHLHPDAVVALAVAADGARLVEECYGGEVGWLAWRRPGFELALVLRDLRDAHPGARGAVLGGHGLICWGDTSDACEANSLELVERAERFLAGRARRDPLGPLLPEMSALPDGERRAEVARLAPVVRGIASHDRRMVGCFSDPPELLDFLARTEAAGLVALGTSCPDHFLRTKPWPLLLDLPPQRPFDERVARLRDLHGEYRTTYGDYYRAHAEAGSPERRAADPAIVLLPGIGMWSFGPDPHAARVAGEFWLDAIAVMRGAESVSSYAPLPDLEKFRIEYWSLEERKLRMRPAPPPLAGRVALVTGAGSGIGRAIAERLAGAGACLAAVDLDGGRAEEVAGAIGDERALAVRADVSDEADVDAAFDRVALRFGGVDIVVNDAGLAASSALVDTTVDEWDRLHAVLARGSFLVSRAAARTMLAQGIGGDIVYVVSKNALVAGPRNVSYGSAKADQAHQVRLLAAELGPHGIRVNGVNPDAVVRGSGIFAGEWREQRAAAYGVAPDELGAYYASRTLLGEEVLPEHVAEAVYVLVAGSLSRTTGLLVPVDGGVPGAFLR